MSEKKSNIPTTSSGSAVEPSADGEVDAFLATVKKMPPVVRSRSMRGRLMFAMDATMSRQPTWDTALSIQSEMFEETGKIGGLDVQLVYFRGFRECQASKWVSDPKALAALMTQVDCRGGKTQIGKILHQVRKEANQAGVDAVVYVGDCMEENVDGLCAKAGEIGLLGIPMFMFQEGRDARAEQAFREIARLTRGAYCRFDQASAGQLRELLSAVAAYAAGGRAALVDYSSKAGSGPRALLKQLT